MGKGIEKMSMLGAGRGDLHKPLHLEWPKKNIVLLVFVQAVLEAPAGYTEGTVHYLAGAIVAAYAPGTSC